MRWRVNPHSGVPLYVQIEEQVKTAIAAGVLEPGARLPTVPRVGSRADDQSKYGSPGVSGIGTGRLYRYDTGPGHVCESGAGAADGGR